MLTLLDRLKPEYKEKLNDQCIKILSKHQSYIDLNVIDANSLCWDLTSKSLQLGVLLDLFYEIKDISFKNYKIELNENYHVAHPESKYIFWNTENNEEAMGNGRSVEECIELINEKLEQ